MKPIEEGCLAVVVGGRMGTNIGTEVTVGRFVDNAPFYTTTAHSIWEVDPPLVWYNESEGDKLRPYAPEYCLLRIDGYEEEEKTEQEAVHEVDN